jgi:hypothetical protein
MRFAMSVLTTCTALLMGFRVAWGQGTVTFNNRNLAAGVDARVTFLDGTGVGAGFTAQLYGGPEGSSIEQLTPLFPTTTFRTTPALALGYVFGVTVVLPGLRPEQRAVLVMRVFNGSAWENSTCSGESNPITVVLSGGQTRPPTNLVGLQPFSVDCVPEPRTLALLGLAAGAWCLARWTKHSL